VNALDFYPLDAAAWNANQPGAGGAQATVTVTNVGSTRAVSVSWNALPQTSYTVEYTTSLTTPNWQPLTSYTNVVVKSGAITILDTNLPVGQTQRFYRLR